MDKNVLLNNIVIIQTKSNKNRKKILWIKNALINNINE